MKELADAFYGCTKAEKCRFGFVIYASFKDSAFTVIKRAANFLTRYMKGVSFVY